LAKHPWPFYSVKTVRFCSGKKSGFVPSPTNSDFLFDRNESIVILRQTEVHSMEISFRAMPVSNQHHGCSLAQLVAVLTLVGILTALLVPVVGSLKLRVQRADGPSIMGETGMALNLYTADNDGMKLLPIDELNNSSQQSWMVLK
jgi:hypothetical protein